MHCVKCGKPLPPQLGHGRKRTKCLECSPRDDSYVPVTRIPIPLDSIEPGKGRLASVTRGLLSDLGKLDTPLGQLALFHAELLDAGCGSQTAAVSREYRAAFADATKGVQGGSTALDELRARRAKRAGG